MRESGACSPTVPRSMLRSAPADLRSRLFDLVYVARLMSLDVERCPHSVPSMWRALDPPRDARSFPSREASVDDPRAGAPRAGAAGTVAAASRADQHRTRVAFDG